MAVMQIATRPRQSTGWRGGKPVEDPEKLKRWGFVTARPSEYLIHVRRGRLRRRSSGQGASCFKWPWDAVAVVPTSLQRLAFRADQITLERVGVEVVGLAVYRIAEPLLAYRVLNFSYPERAQEKLEQTLTSMFVGATRRLVANLAVDDCLQKRKTALADELLAEIAPVVGGEGRPDDETNKGWGVVIDSIEIQEVRILSESVFAAMQAPYRAALDRQARTAQAAAAQDVATREAACEQAIEEARIAAEQEVEARREAQATLRAEAEQQRRLAAVAREAEVRRRQAEAEAAAERAALASQAEAAAERTRVEVQARALEVEAARAEIDSAEARIAAEEKRIALARLRDEAARAARAAEAEVARVEGESRAAVSLAEARAAEVHAAAEARRLTAEKLPTLAAAVGARVGEVNITRIGGDEALNPVIGAVSAVVELARGMADR